MSVFKHTPNILDRRNTSTTQLLPGWLPSPRGCTAAQIKATFLLSYICFSHLSSESLSLSLPVTSRPAASLFALVINCLNLLCYFCLWNHCVWVRKKTHWSWLLFRAALPNIQCSLADSSMPLCGHRRWESFWTLNRYNRWRTSDVFCDRVCVVQFILTGSAWNSKRHNISLYI